MFFQSSGSFCDGCSSVLCPSVDLTVAAATLVDLVSTDTLLLDPHTHGCLLGAQAVPPVVKVVLQNHF